jgi:hypothetical protein
LWRNSKQSMIHPSIMLAITCEKWPVVWVGTVWPLLKKTIPLLLPILAREDYGVSPNRLSICLIAKRIE